MTCEINLSANLTTRRGLKEMLVKAYSDVPIKKIKDADATKQIKPLKTRDFLHKSTSCPCFTSNTYGLDKNRHLPRTQSAVFPNKYHFYYRTNHPQVFVPHYFRSYFFPLPSISDPLNAVSRPVEDESEPALNPSDAAKHLCVACGCSVPCGCCLPAPCNQPPRCVQCMTGCYYYPYGSWYCGPYNVCTGSCGSCSPGGSCPGGSCGPCESCCVCYGLNKKGSVDCKSYSPLSKLSESAGLSSSCSPIALSCEPCCGPCRVNCNPCGPYGPCRPCGPCGPCSQCTPFRCCGPFGSYDPYRIWGLYCGRCCGPCGYFGPCSRCRSCGPSRPCGPCGPCGQCGPCGPCHPCGPCSPCGTCSPYGSCGPVGPCFNCTCTPFPVCGPVSPDPDESSEPVGTCPKCCILAPRMTTDPESSREKPSLCFCPICLAARIQTTETASSNECPNSMAPRPLPRAFSSSPGINPNLVRTYPFNKPKPKLYPRMQNLGNTVFAHYFSTSGKFGMSTMTTWNQKPCKDSAILPKANKCPCTGYHNKYCYNWFLLCNPYPNMMPVYDDVCPFVWKPKPFPTKNERDMPCIKPDCFRYSNTPDYKRPSPPPCPEMGLVVGVYNYRQWPPQRTLFTRGH